MEKLLKTWLIYQKLAQIARIWIFQKNFKKRLSKDCEATDWAQCPGSLSWQGLPC